MTQRICIVFLLLIVIVNPRVNGSDDKAGIAPGTWQEAAMKRGLSEEEIAILQKDDILLTNQEYRQIYSAYSHPDISVFITSDSLLNAYHVLLEESIVQLEASQVSRLSETLKMILTDLELLRFSVQDQPELNAAAQRRARLVIGIAVRLLEKSFRLGDAELDAILAAESARIESAQGEFLPEWLGSPGPSLLVIHYSRFRPRSFYTRNVHLERYFRAVSWLQAIPFRIEQDEELLAMLMLGHALRVQPPGPEDEADNFDRFESSEKAKNTFRHYYELVGEPDLPDILVAADEAYGLHVSTPEMPDEEMSEEDAIEEQDPENEIPEAESFDDPNDGQTKSSRGFGGQFGGGAGSGFGSVLDRGPQEEPQDRILLFDDLQRCRESLRTDLRKAGIEPQINDQDREPPDDPQQVDDLQFRVISASRTPDAVLFQRTTDSRKFTRNYPGGLEVAIALGSSAARSFLIDPEKERVLQEIDSCKDLFHTENLYGIWLNTLMALFDEPEIDAPEFMRSDAWQRKSCNTVLASWTQLWHTYALHAKVLGGSGGGLIPPPGFVEPDPEFFSRMANLAERMKWTLYSDDELQPLPPDYRPLLSTLESMKGLANEVAHEAVMDQKLKDQFQIDDILRGLAYYVKELVSQQSESDVPYGDRWNRVIDQHLSPAKIISIKNLADGVLNSEAMYDKNQEQSGLFAELPESLFFGLIHLADEHPGKELPWSDRWNQMCDRHLPQVLESLRHLADGIADTKAMEALIENRWSFENQSSRDALTRLVHKLTLPPVDIQISYSDLWDRVVERLIQQIQNDSSDKNPELTAIVDPGVSDLRDVWDDLISTSRRLEVIAHKQLRGADLNKSEVFFILSYDATLAHLMLRHEILTDDDAPWAIGVYTNYQLGQTLHAATSRPRAIYVLYPWGGTKVLSRGAILPYREVISDSPLTDEEWRQQLDSGTAPPLPDWLQPILSPSP